MTTPSTRVVPPLAALALAAALTALLLGGLNAPPAAMAQVDPAGVDALGRVSGLVTDPQGRPVEGIQVDFYSENHPRPWLPWYLDSVRTVKTNAAGGYTTPLTPGIYRVRFSDPNGVYALQYYSGALTAPAAADVVVAGNVSDGVSAQLGLGGSIIGTAARPDTFADYSVVAYREARGTWQVAQEVILGTANTYTLRGLAPGVYHVCLAPTQGGRDGALPCYEHVGGGAPYGKDVPLTAGEIVANIDIAAAGFLDLATVRGRVTDKGGVPLAGIEVHVSSDQMAAPTTTTDAAGAYELQVRAPSTVRVAFDNPGGLYVVQWYTGTEDAGAATELMLQPNEVRGGIDGALTLGGRITGTITLSGVTPGGALNVFALPAVRPYLDIYGYAGLYYSGVYDIRTGRYTIGGLPPGDYRVCESPQASPTWQSRHCFEQRADATPPTVTVTAGATANGVDFLLVTPPAPEGYVLTGTVTAGDGMPLGGMEIQLFSFPEGIISNKPPWLATTTTAGDGSYRFNGLQTGQYQLRAMDPTGLYAATVYTNPVDGFSSILLSKSPQEPRDIRMARGGALSGQVRSDDGRPMPYAWLRLFPIGIGYQLYEWPDTNYADADGRFRIGGLPAGRYGVCAGGTTPPRYSESCYGPQPDEGPYWYLNLVHVAAGAETVDVNITLGPVPLRHLYLPLLRGGAGATLSPAAPDMMGRIAGSVRNASDEPLAGIYVDVYQSLAPDGWAGPSYAMQTDAAGHYQFEPMVPGVYRVAFHDPTGIYAQQYYSGALTFDAATTLTINGSFLDGIDGRLEQAGSITGTVLDNSAPYVSIGVFAQVDGTWRLAATAEYDSQQHTYSAHGLSPGMYRVCWYTGAEPVVVTGPCYEHIGGGVNFAVGVPVTAGAVTGGIDLTTAGLVDGSAIRGVVRGEGGVPLGGIAVQLSTPNGDMYAPSGHAWTEVRTTHTDASGAFQFDDLLPNDYLLRYSSPDGPYYGQYYGNTQDIARARVITLQRSEQRDNVDITLALGGTISGTILLDGSLPPAEAMVSALRAEGDAFGDRTSYTATYDAQNGAYHIGGLPPGLYQVRANLGYLINYSQPLFVYYGDVTDWSTATIITITAGTRLNNIDINYAQNGFEGVLTGIVTGDGGVPLVGMRTELYISELDWLVTRRLLHTTTSLEGRYRFEGLLDGSYFVRVVDPGGVYTPGFSGSRVFYDLAQPVYFRNGTPIGPVNVQMQHSGTLRGHVYDMAGEPVAGAQVQIPATFSGSSVVTTTVSDAAGSYASGPIPPGRYYACASLLHSNSIDGGCYGARPGSPFDAGVFTLEPGAALDNIDIYFGGVPGIADQIYIPVVGYTPRW